MNDNERNVIVSGGDKQTTNIISVRDGTFQDSKMVPINQLQQQQSSATSVTTQSHLSLHSQIQQHQQQHQHQQPQQHSNIILVRGSRNENGQIILQNSHELLNLLNDEDKPILLQHPRFKTKQQPEGAILLQPAIKGTHQLDGHHGTVLLQSATVKKSTTLPEGSIIVQQRLNKNGTADGPILLQTLKRLDKSQSILVFRNPNNTTTATTITTTNTTTSNRIRLSTGDIDDNSEKQHAPLPAPPPPPPKSINTPLGSGKYNFLLFFHHIFFMVWP